MQLNDTKYKIKDSLRQQIYSRHHQNILVQNDNQRSDSINKIVKINAKKLPPDFFTSSKNKISFSIASRQNSSRTSKQHPINQYSSTVPLTPILITNSLSNSIPKRSPIFVQPNSIQLKPYDDPQINIKSIRKLNSQVKIQQRLLKTRQKRKKENFLIQSVENRPSTFNEFKQANDLFNCTFAKKFCDSSIQSEKIITQKIPEVAKHYQVQKIKSAKKGQQRRLSKHIFDMIQIQKRMSKKVDQFENINSDLKLALNKKIYGQKTKSQLVILSNREDTQLKSIELPPIESARVNL